MIAERSSELVVASRSSSLERTIQLVVEVAVSDVVEAPGYNEGEEG
jgi:hypothetical protein